MLRRIPDQSYRLAGFADWRVDEAPVTSDIHSRTGFLGPAMSGIIRITRHRSHYALSFTSGALLIREALIATPRWGRTLVRPDGVGITILSSWVVGAC
jgi:hypothetical protein